jgi:glucose-1-phosphate thymidylyltransferase
MRLIIPLAGEGTRLRPHTHFTPKPLLEVAGKEVLAHILDPLANLQPSEVVFVVGHLGDAIKEWVENHYDFDAVYVEQKELLGLGYALHLALEATVDDETLIILSDTIVDLDYRSFVTAGDNVLGLCCVDDPGRFGIAEISGNRIVSLEEKPTRPKSDRALIGLYYFRDPSKLRLHLCDLVAKGQRTDGEIQLTDALAEMIATGISFVPFDVDGWYDCGKVETMISTNRRLLEKQAYESQTIDSCTIRQPVYIDPTAVLSNCEIGPNVSVAEGATLTDSTLVDCLVGSGAVVESSSLHDSMVGIDAVVRNESGSISVARENKTV